MKKILILCFAAYASVIYPQELLSKLKAPASPASAILGLQPGAILQPKSYNELEVSLYTNLYDTESGNLIPKDFALEFTPYWFQDHGLKLEDYLYPKNILKDQILKNSSFSIASMQSYPLGDSSKSKSVGAGYRTTLHIPNGQDRAMLDSLVTALDINLEAANSLKQIADEIIRADSAIDKSGFFKQMKAQIRNDYYDDSEMADRLIKISAGAVNAMPELASPGFLEKFGAYLDNELFDGLDKKYYEYIRNRQGIYIDIAAATMVNFPTNNFEYSYVPRYSVWISPSYRFSNTLDFLSISGVLRLQWTNDDYYVKYFPGADDTGDSFDYGFAASGEFGRLSLQLEMTARENIGKNSGSDLQYMGVISYNITDEIIASYTLGNRFKPEFNPEDTLISLLSLNFGFGTPAKEDITN
ncbi:MAG TPA: hypothetical protein VHP30_07190 [Ignavibacteriales bacterium]|nr:hypothetical protein [Ignavibacteriales bacterium]